MFPYKVSSIHQRDPTATCSCTDQVRWSCHSRTTWNVNLVYIVAMPCSVWIIEQPGLQISQAQSWQRSQNKPAADTRNRPASPKTHYREAKKVPLSKMSCLCCKCSPMKRNAFFNLASKGLGCKCALGSCWIRYHFLFCCQASSLVRETERRPGVTLQAF